MARLFWLVASNGSFFADLYPPFTARYVRHRAPQKRQKGRELCPWARVLLVSGETVTTGAVFEMWGSTSTLLRWSHHDWPCGRKPRAVFWETVVLPQWVLRDSYPRTEGRASRGRLPSSISSHQQGSAMMFSSMTSRLSSCWIMLWHQILALTSIWRYPLTLSLVFWTYKALGFTSELSRPKMMSCHFEWLQFLEYYQEFKKKSSSLNTACPQGVQTKLGQPKQR